MGAGKFVLGDVVMSTDFSIFHMLESVKSDLLDHIETEMSDSHPQLHIFFSSFKSVLNANEWY